VKLNVVVMQQSPGQTVTHGHRHWPRKLAALLVAGVTVLGWDVACSSATGASGWHQVAELVGSGTVANDAFGFSVAVSGSAAVVGAPYHSQEAGRAYVFTRSASGWHQTAELVGSGTAGDDNFGYSVALSGSTAVVGAPYHSKDAGRAYVFSASASGWHQTAELVGSDTAIGDKFGTSVAVSGSTAVVGAPDHAAYAGRAYVFSGSASGWHQTAELVGSGMVGAGGFGASLALSGSTLVVGAPAQVHGAGRAYVFSGSASGWHQTAELVGSGTIGLDALGYSVALSGSSVVAGAPGHAHGAGRAYVFSGSASGWHQTAELVGSDTTPGDTFGSAVAVSGDTVVAGADGYGLDAGRAYVFTRSASGWHQTAELVGSDTGTFGSSAAVTGSTVVIGAPSYASDTGGVCVFQG
jgi:hypothetical protein